MDDLDYSVFTQTSSCKSFVVAHGLCPVFYGLFVAFKVGVCETLKIGFVLLSVYGASIAQPSRAAAS